jgi:hypothetical protein
MFILNTGLSHKSKDWLMSSTTEIKKTKRRVSLKKDVGSVQTGTLFSHWVISGAVDLGFQFGLYG